MHFRNGNKINSLYANSLVFIFLFFLNHIRCLLRRPASQEDRALTKNRERCGGLLASTLGIFKDCQLNSGRRQSHALEAVLVKRLTFPPRC